MTIQSPLVKAQLHEVDLLTYLGSNLDSSGETY